MNTETELIPDQIPWDKLEPEPVILDRSTLERWADCPHQAALIAHHKIKIDNEHTEAGSQCHDAISDQIAHVVGTDDRIVRTGEFADRLIDAGKNCPRTDVQPRVAMILQYSAWTIARIVCERDPSDIMRFDGGKGEYSGQLAADLAGHRITGELDLLLATPSKEELDYYDWKSGFTRWTATDVKNAFQFQVYAWLILANYPEVQRVNVRVAMLAENEVTGAVAFERRYLHQYESRIKTAIDLYGLHSEQDPADVPAWPAPSKCATCDAVRHCRLASHQTNDVASDPVEAIKSLIAMEAASERIRVALTASVRKTGSDVVAAIGDKRVAFGTNKPKAARATPCALYELPG